MKIELNAYAAAVIQNIGLFIVIGIAIWLLKSGWPLLALVFLTSSDED